MVSNREVLIIRKEGQPLWEALQKLHDSGQYVIAARNAGRYWEVICEKRVDVDSSQS